MKRSFLALLFCLAFLLSACGVDPQTQETTAATEPLVTMQMDALSELREDMKPPVIAVANLGFPELSADFGIKDYLLDEYPKWIEENNFILEMSNDQIIYTTRTKTDWGEWICIVPRDPQSTVCVNVIRYTEDYSGSEEKVIHRSEKGDPILLQADISENVFITVVVTDSEGRGVSWTPYWGNAVPIPEDNYFGALVMDFTPPSEKSPYEHYQTEGWRSPELSELVNSFWLSWEGYAIELMDDSIPDNNGGWANLYDVGEIGEYTRSYAGSWQYSDNLLHLSLVPDFEDGHLVDDSFPVLMLDGQLWIGRNDSAVALPHFHDSQIMDILEQPKG